MDATIAVSESGANKLMEDPIALATKSASDSGTWGPFTVGYSASVALSGGPGVSVSLIDPDLLSLHNVNVSGSVGVFFSFDLGAILPTVCIPPVQVCVDIPFVGTVCTPQVCLTWPKLTVPITLPFALTVSADFHVGVKDGGPKWQIVANIVTASVFVDLTPMAGAIVSAIQAEVNATLGAIPGIGGLLASLVDLVVAALGALLTPILLAISLFVKGVILLVSLFDPTIPVVLARIPKQHKVLPAAGPSDPEVDLTITSLNTSVHDHELIATADFA